MLIIEINFFQLLLYYVSVLFQMSSDYDHLTLMQKVEVFEHALDTTQGDDLAKLLWLKSPSSEVWFDRRTNYTRSLAVMSMVGYILGLGDRYVMYYTNMFIFNSYFVIIISLYDVINLLIVVFV